MRYRHFSALLFVILILAGVGIYPASAGDVYLVRDIPVSASANSVAQARTIALGNGHSTALAKLLKRLTLPEIHYKLPSTSARVAQEMALGFEVEDEKSSDVRYLGKLSVRFDAAKVRALLLGAKIPFGDVQARPALLLAYEVVEGGVQVWDAAPPLRAAFESMDLANGLVPLILPAGDAGDRLALDESGVLAAIDGQNYDSLYALMQRYDLHHVMLVHAERDIVSELVEVTMVWLRPETEAAKRSFIMPFAAEQDSSRLWRRVADTALAIASDSWKRRVLVAKPDAEKQRVLILFDTQREWNLIHQKLRALPILRVWRLHSISLRGAVADIDIAAPVEIFALALAQEDIILDSSKTPWKLSLSQ